MKKYKSKIMNATYIVAETETIKSCYKSITRNKNTNIYPIFVDKPKFNANKPVYALCVKQDDNGNQWLSVISPETMMTIIVANEVQEVSSYA